MTATLKAINRPVTSQGFFLPFPVITANYYYFWSHVVHSGVDQKLFLWHGFCV